MIFTWMILSAEQIQSQKQLCCIRNQKKSCQKEDFISGNGSNSNSPEVCKAIENYEAQLSENLTDSKTSLQKDQNATGGLLEDDSSFVNQN